jgi:peptide/nickel transport system substrate-binding protein
MLLRNICWLLLLLCCGSIASAKDTVLVIGMNISDGRTYDPGRQADISTPLTIGNTYETLVTVMPGDYETIKPSLAEKWEVLQNGKLLRFYIRPTAKFWNGSPVTAEDVKFSYDRLKHLKDQPAMFTDNIESVLVVNDRTVDILVKNQAEPLLSVLTTVSFAVYSKAEVTKLGGVSDVTAHNEDKATPHFNNQSFGSGPYRMTAWNRNENVVLERNMHWHEPLMYNKVIIKHIADGAGQLLALRNKDIDIAFNLTREQLENLLRFSKDHRIESVASLDYVYMILSNNDKFNPALADNNARLAIAHAIDYDGIIKHLLGGQAIRPTSILPIGIGGSSEAYTKEFGYKYDLVKAKEYLKKSRYPRGFEFTFSFPTSPILNVNTSILVQKIQADLAKVGITAKLQPMDMTNLVTQYRNGNSHAAVVSYTIDALEPSLWTRPFVGRIAKRVHWQPPQILLDITERAAVELDVSKRNQLYKLYQQNQVDAAVFINLIQPVYNVAVLNDLLNVRLTAAGWYLDLSKIIKVIR